MGVSILSGCQRDRSVLLKIKVEEVAGLKRPLEYVKISLPHFKHHQEDHKIYVYSKNGKEIISAQIVKTIPNKEIQIVFLISIKGNETQDYIIKAEPDKHIKPDTDLNVLGDALNVIVDNKYFSASFKEFIGYKQDTLGAGHLGSILLKEFEDVVLERKAPNLKIHWGPNFSKEKMTYRTMAHITSPDSSYISTKEPFYFSLFKSGYVEGYEKILLKGIYEFYAGLPYIVFDSEITFTENDTLNLLRNDEMTMDSLFTHVVFPRSSAKMMDLQLYNENSMTYLEEEPITDDAPWLFFYNKSKSYAFGSIRIQYDNKNIYGGNSPTENKHTKITASANSGRYWNRRLINSKNTFIPKGSKYSEKNAYIVFKIDENDPAKTIKYYYECLKNPVKVSYMD